ncbi:hypothetical protein ACHQM5_007027 [Ranunculus cassubicifolius]
MAFPLSGLLLIVLLNLHYSKVSAEHILEDGYTVSTILDGNKLTKPIYPSSILTTTGTHSLVVLDSPNSVFYTIPFPISQESEIRRYSGNGSGGFADGDLSSAMFDRPKSFAVDFKGNVYVADKMNHAIRKISKSGVTTIAGGHSGKPGKIDGPAQYASFSEDFELTFDPKVCALLIADRGNRLIRQMNLKPSDCESSSQWHLGASGSVLLGVSCFILGSIIALVGSLIVYPVITSHETMGKHMFKGTWKHYRIHLERQVVTVYSDSKNVVASIYLVVCRIARMGISHLSLMLSIPKVEKTVFCEDVSFFDSDVGSNCETAKPEEKIADQLKNLIMFDENPEKAIELDTIPKVSVCGCGSIDEMIHANISDFSSHTTQKQSLVKRK